MSVYNVCVSEMLLQTKLHIPPPRPNLVARPYLTDRLNQGLLQGSKLALVTAPAGFGKSTLIISWIQQAEQQVAWLSLDKGDNDPTRFWSYVFTAIKHARPELAEDALIALGAPQPPPIEALLTGLINRATTLSTQLILTLEDYYLVDNPVIHTAITFLLENLPSQLHLLLSGRSDPPLPLATLRGHGQLTEIRESDLRFSNAEAFIFFQDVMGLRLSSEAVATLNARTEGWVVGLQLAGLALQGREDTAEFIATFAGDHSYVINYLTDEVFDRQSGSLRAFLLQTSILDRLHGPLCDAVISDEVMNRGGSQDTLEHLVDQNLFLIPLDNRRQWYRYHRLFADLLRYRLQRTYPTLIPDLHRRACEWFSENNFIADALQHALAAEDFFQAADLIESVTRTMLGRGEARTVQAWIENLPGALLQQRPRLCIALAWAYNLNQEDFDEGGSSQIEPLLRAAEKALDSGAFSPEIVADVRGNAAVLRGFTDLQQNNPPQALQYMEASLAILPEDDVYLRSLVNLTQGVVYKRGGIWQPAAEKLSQATAYGLASGNLTVAVGTRTHLIEMLITQGQLQHAARMCEETITYHLSDGPRNPVPYLGFVYCKLGEILYEWNKLDAASHNLEHGLTLADKLMVTWSWTRDGLITLSRVRQLQGDFEGAQVLVERAIDMSHQMQDLFDRIDVSFWQARLWLAQNNLPAAARWATEYRADVESRIEAADMVLARVFMAQGETGQALDLLAPISEAAGETGRKGAQIESLTLQALTYQGQGDLQQAQTSLVQALSLAEPEGYLRTFVDEGSPMKALLTKRLASSGDDDSSRTYVIKLLGAFPEKITQSFESSSAAIFDTLTEREVQVLGLLAAGLKTPEIASELHLANSTAKWYLRNIYSKLDVHRRADAIARAYELDLL